MRTYFYGEGWRNIARWKCPRCKNYCVTGLDSLVKESEERHLKTCSRLALIEESEEFRIAQERMHQLKEHRESLTRLMDVIDKEVDLIFEQSKVLLKKHPTLSLSGRQSTEK
jgi:hypothetical protein